MQYTYDIDCELLNAESCEKLCEFEARAVSAKRVSGGFTNGGTPSGEQAYEIATACSHDFQPYNERVRVKGQTFLIVAKRVVTGLKLGTLFGVEPASETILELQ